MSSILSNKCSQHGAAWKLSEGELSSTVYAIDEKNQ